MKSIFTVFLLLLITSLSAQLCTGNLGSNIFDDGNFGTGTDRVLLTNPNIAPGYQYVTFVPNDGQYTLTHNTKHLSGLYPSWLEIGDRTDQNGYIMVVNASYLPGIFYEKEIVGLCPNTQYEFSADVINLIRAGVLDHIFPDVAFLLDGVVKYTTGPIRQTEQWNKVGFSFVTDMNQTSVKLTLRNNAQGGIGNDIAMDNISFRACGPKSFVSIESGQTIYKCKDSQPFTLKAAVNGLNQYIIWQTSSDGLAWTNLTQGQVYEIIHDRFVPGSYYYRYLTAGDEFNIQNEKCRVISDAVLVEVVKDIYEKFDTVCLGNKYVFGPFELDTTGIYTHTFTSSLGCDSTVNLNLERVDKNDLGTNSLIENPKCFETTTGEILDFRTSGGHPPYVINVESSLGQLVANYNNMDAGKYKVIVKDRNGCISEEQIELIDPPLFVIESIPDTVVQLGEEIVLSVNSNYEVDRSRWDSPDFSSDQLQPIYRPSNSSTLNLIAFNANDCAAEDQVDVVVNRDYRIFYPNILSLKSSDGNDEFTFQSFNNIIEKIAYFEVYDRYGNVVESISDSDIDYSWQGFTGSQKISQGVYTFIAKLLLINGETISKNGTITVVE